MSLSRIKEAIEKYNQAMIDNLVDGEPRWKHYNVQRKVAQAAVNFKGYIVTGTRHFCPIMMVQIRGVGKELLREWCPMGEEIQGFTDQYGVFMDREEAFLVAKEANQLLPEHNWGNTLYSESYI